MIISFAVHKGSKGKMTEDFEENAKKLNQTNNGVYRHHSPITADTLKSIKTTTEYVDKLLVEANNILLQKFGEENHGVALPNIVEMLTAVGIDVNKNINLQNSLRHFVYYRGDYAHRGIYSKISRIFNKSDILLYYSDCLVLCDDVYNNAKIKL